MSEDSSGVHFRQAARKRADSAKVADFTLMVKVARQPTAIRVFTATEDAEARQYASEYEGTVIPLPLPPPRADLHRLGQAVAGLRDDDLMRKAWE